MSEYGILEVDLRKAGGKGGVRKLRAAGKFPAVIYGGGKDNVTIAIDPREFNRASDPNKGFNTFFRLSIKEGDKTLGVEQVMIADFQRDALRTDMVHVDFMRVETDREVVRPVPVRVVGRAVGVVKGGRIRTPYRTVKIAAKPADVPTEVVVDVTPLDNGDAVRMKDVVLPNARVVEPAEAALAMCEIAYAKAEEEPTAAAAGGAAKAAPAKAAPAKAAPAKAAPAKK